jgi:hypothetical protein
MSAAEIHAARMAARRDSAPASANGAPMMSPRSRLDSFRAERAKQEGGAPAEAGGSSRLDSYRAARGFPPAAAPAAAGFHVAMPPAPSDAMPSVPALGLNRRGSTGSMESPRGGADDVRPLSSRRLKKEVLKADSSCRDSSNSAGHIMLRDEMGTPRSMRVVQNETFEDFNMVSVKWLCTDSVPFQIELRHGRKSGIRKIYVNKELIERNKTISNLVRRSLTQHPKALAHQPRPNAPSATNPLRYGASLAPLTRGWLHVPAGCVPSARRLRAPAGCERPPAASARRLHHLPRAA